MFMYINGKDRVKWNKEVSEYFNVTNGVRHGSVLSPYLFSIYIDELIENLEKSGKCCWVGKQFYGVLVSCLWDLFGVDSQNRFTTWNIAMRIILELPNTNS